MKLYISTIQPQEKDFVWIKNINDLDVLVHDGEATQIVVKNFLSKIDPVNVDAFYKKIISKLSLKGSIKFVELDFELATYKFNRNDLNIQQLAELLFRHGAIHSVFTLAVLRDMTTHNGLNIHQSYVIQDTNEFVLVGGR
jgi:hypothetical protein